MGKGIRYPHIETLLRKHYMGKNGRVLELGAGGVVYKDIFSEYMGIDLPECTYSEKGDIGVYCDAHHLPFKKNTFEFAFVVAAAHQLRDFTLVCSEVWRVLKSGGHFVIFDYNKKTTKRLKRHPFYNVWSQKELKRIVQGAGFRARIINPSEYDSSKGIKASIKKIPGFYFITNLLFGVWIWNIIVATKLKQK